jgi:purine-nucleoside phosphorylase
MASGVYPRPEVAHLHPTAELAERALLPDDPGQALALAGLLFDDAPRMFNHQRGLWGYSGTAADGAPLSVQSTGVGGPSAAVVVTELAALGLRRAVRVGRAWALDGAVRPGELVAVAAALCGDGTSRALGAGARAHPDARLTAALDGAGRLGLVASGDVPEADPAWAREGAIAFDLETAAVLAAAQRAGIAAAGLVAVAGDGAALAPDDPAHAVVAERLGRAALAALSP